MTTGRTIGLNVTFATVLIVANFVCAIDITFFAISDTHYGQTGAPSSGTGIQAKDTSRARMPGILNSLPGTAYPTSIGGTIDAPRGVLLPGDLVETLDTNLWIKYTTDYGVNGEKKVHFPVYDGLGNHDQPGVSTLILSRFVARSATRQNPVNYDSAGYNYSWDWDGVHFVHLNLYAGGLETGYFSSTGFGGNPLNSRGFLQNDLAQRVGSSGLPVFIMQHYPLTDTTYWNNSAKQQLYSILQPYNVIGILHGHSHAQAMYKWNNIDIYDDGTVMDGDIMVFHITDGRMVAAHRSFVGTGTSGNGQEQWSTLIKDKTISMGTATAITKPDGSRAGLFTVAGTSQRMPASVRSVEILDLYGHFVGRVRVSNFRADWDRRDSKGYLAPPGIYFLKSSGQTKAFGKIALR